MEEFHVGRFREDNAKGVVTNFISFIDSDGHLSELRRTLDELDCTDEPLSSKVQANEPAAREFMMNHLVFYHKGEKIHAKRKPPRDFLINVGFARTLIPFDSRMKKVFKEIFDLSVSDANYEPIEDFFLGEVYSTLQLSAAQFDRIVFKHYKNLSS